MRRCRLRWLVLVAAVLPGACGARTPLNVELCPSDGERQSCRNACGEGTQTCIAGVWTECDVPPAERSCSDTCGEGLQTCSDGRWGVCQVPDTERPCSSICGAGVERCSSGEWQTCDAPQPKAPVLQATLRDFLDSHPDFESEDVGRDPGIVEDELGEDDKPVYAHPRGGTETTTGRTNFDQWYRDVEGVNRSTTFDIPLSPVPGTNGVHVYSKREFYPLDGQLFGNEGRPHNYHFTLELHTEFRYSGGEVFTFTGDDDLWVFINRRLAIDLGGTHTPLTESVALDQRAGELGIEPGGIYDFDLFFAERHTVQSNFHIETTISEFAVCD